MAWSILCSLMALTVYSPFRILIASDHISKTNTHSFVNKSQNPTSAGVCDAKESLVRRSNLDFLCLTSRISSRSGVIFSVDLISLANIRWRKCFIILHLWSWQLINRKANASFLQTRMWFLPIRSQRRSILGFTGTTTWWTVSGTESSPFRSTHVGKCMMRSDNFLTSKECRVAEQTITWERKYQHITISVWKYTPGVLKLCQYLQPFAISGDLWDLIVDPVDKICVTCR